MMNQRPRFEAKVLLQPLPALGLCFALGTLLSRHHCEVLSSDTQAAILSLWTHRKTLNLSPDTIPHPAILSDVSDSRYRLISLLRTLFLLPGGD